MQRGHVPSWGRDERGGLEAPSAPKGPWELPREGTDHVPRPQAPAAPAYLGAGSRSALCQGGTRKTPFMP